LPCWNRHAICGAGRGRLPGGTRFASRARDCGRRRNGWFAVTGRSRRRVHRPRFQLASFVFRIDRLLPARCRKGHLFHRLHIGGHGGAEPVCILLALPGDQREHRTRRIFIASGPRCLDRGIVAEEQRGGALFSTHHRGNHLPAVRIELRRGRQRRHMIPRIRRKRFSAASRETHETREHHHHRQTPPVHGCLTAKSMALVNTKSLSCMGAWQFTHSVANPGSL